MIFHSGNRLRGTNARNDVLALSVDKKLTVKNLFARGRIARESHARTGLTARVSEYHGLNVNGRSPVGRDVVFAPVYDRAIVHPGTKDRADGAIELFPRIGWKIASRTIAHEFLESDDELFQIVGSQLWVVDIRVIALVL